MYNPGRGHVHDQVCGGWRVGGRKRKARQGGSGERLRAIKGKKERRDMEGKEEGGRATERSSIVAFDSSLERKGE